MSILLIPWHHRVSDAFCDFLNVSIPSERSESVLSECRSVLDTFGLSDEGHGTFKVGGPDGGTFKHYRRGGVTVLSLSGHPLGLLRDRGLLNAYLTPLADGAHRVTQMHATCDFVAQSPAQVVQAVFDAAVAGFVQLTRKALPSGAITRYQSINHRGELTGTVYLGKRRNADVWAKVYDKQHERLSRGFSDPGSLVRVEIALQSDVGCSLRDVVNPSPVFLKFARRSLVEAPADYVEWEPGGQGFVLEPRQDNLTAMQRIEALLDVSPDVERLIRWSVDAYGQRAHEFLSQALRRRMGGSPAM